jgi:hypothetical protein
VTTPLDVLKTRLMTQGTSGRYKNLIDATIQVQLQTARFRRVFAPVELAVRVSAAACCRILMIRIMLSCRVLMVQLCLM